VKFRNGFVSNSSSTSFIVFFKHIPKSIEELKTMMFPRQNNDDTIDDDYDTKMTIGNIVQEVFNDINTLSPAKEKNILEEVYLSSVQDTRYDYKCSKNHELLKQIKDKADKAYQNTIHFENYMIRKYHITFEDIYTFSKMTSKDLMHEENKKLKKDIKGLKKLRNIDRKASKEYSDAQVKFRTEYVKEFIEKNKLQNSIPFILEYSDNTAEGSVMENGGIFSNIPHIKINKH